MKRIGIVFFLFAVIFFFCSASVFADKCKEICKPTKIDSGVLTFEKDVPTKIFNGHTVTYYGLYNGGPSYLLNFNNHQSSLHTDKLGEVKSIVDSEPPFFIDMDVIEYDENYIKLRFTRFETPQGYDPNIKLSW